ncbi:PhlD [Streptomyces sp. NPDC089919]|uniref:PhlD n=1 Tax=Streptomyces sp. NPDC089919 TaxID=3155188 RepID=UPI003430F568
MSTAEIVEDIARQHAGHPRLSAALRLIGNCGVETRYMTRPLHSPTVAGEASPAARVDAARRDALDLATRAAALALDSAGLTAADIDCLVTSHSTVPGVPGLGPYLVNDLGLRATVRRIPSTTLGCAGGSHALTRAAEYVAAHPGRKVLVVASEVHSVLYNRAATSLSSMLFRALFGDGAAACVVGGDPLGPGLCITDSWEYLLPGSTEELRGFMDDDGLRLESPHGLMAAASDALPPLREWYVDSAGAERPGPYVPPEVAVLHPGGPKILEGVSAGLGLAREAVRHSWDSLREYGNLGATAVLDILARTHESAPPAGAPALLVGYGPGFTAIGCRGYWHR